MTEVVSKNAFVNLRREMTPRMIMVTLIGTFGSMTFAYDSGWWGSALGHQAFRNYYGDAINPATGVRALTPTQQSCGTALGVAGTMIGCMITTIFGRRLGRKRSLLLLAVIGCMGSIIQITSVIGNRPGPTKFWQLVAGKIIVNSSVGIATTVVPPYLAEVSPSSVRGFIVSCHNIAEAFGGILASATMFGMQNRRDRLPWMLPCGLQMVIPALMIACSPLLPESPRWLVEVGRTEEAIASVERLRQGRSDAAAEVSQIQEAIHQHEQLTGGTSWSQLFRGSNTRRTMITIAMTCFQQGMGVSMVNNYLVVTLLAAGVKSPIMFQFISSCVQFVVMFTVGSFAPDTFGRRPMLLGGASFMGASLFINGGISAATDSKPTGHAQRAYIGMWFVWIIAFVSSWGPLSWGTMAEVPSAALREKSVGLGAWAGFAVGMTVNFVQPYLNASIGGQAAFLYASISPFAIAFTYFLIPELKGRSLEEVDEMFTSNVAARKSKHYVCRGVAAQDRELASHELDESKKGEDELLEEQQKV